MVALSRGEQVFTGFAAHKPHGHAVPSPPCSRCCGTANLWVVPTNKTLIAAPVPGVNTLPVIHIPVNKTQKGGTTFVCVFWSC